MATNLMPSSRQAGGDGARGTFSRAIYFVQQACRIRRSQSI